MSPFFPLVPMRHMGTSGKKMLLYEVEEEGSMEQIINIHIEKLPEGVYLATTDDIPGLVAQGRTVVETMEIARDVARKILESQEEKRKILNLPIIGDSFDCPLVVGV